MRFIGITGGVGAGKSKVLEYLNTKEKTKVLLADEIAHLLMEPGQKCYQQIIDMFQEDDILNEDLTFNRNALANKLFSDENKRIAMNAIVHPAVKEYVQREYATELQRGELEYLFLEAALLFEEHYDEICDEIWYIYTSEENRCKRLLETRGYSREKALSIMARQMSEEEFLRRSKFTIDNNGSLEELYQKIEEGLRNG